MRLLGRFLEKDRLLWGRGGERFSDFVAPWPLFAVVVMVVNDRVLKPHYPGLVAGKLTDFAFCFFGPLYVAALLSLVPRLTPRWRAAAGVLVTFAYFVPLKISQSLCDVYVILLDAVGRGLGLDHHVSFADPSDLLALCILPLAYAHARARSHVSPTFFDLESTP